MKLLGIFLTACVVLAAAQAAAAALAVLFLIGIVYGLFFYPREMIGLLGISILASLIKAFPLPCLALIALMTVAGMLRRK